MGRFSSLRDYHITKGGSCSQSLQLGDFRQAFMPHLTVDGATSVQEVSGGKSLFWGEKLYGRNSIWWKRNCIFENQLQLASDGAPQLSGFNT